MEFPPDVSVLYQITIGLDVIQSQNLVYRAPPFPNHKQKKNLYSDDKQKIGRRPVVFFVVEMSEIKRDKELTMLVTCKSTVFTRDTSLITLGY